MTSEPRATAKRPTRVRWLVFALACGTSWFLYLHRYSWNFIAPELDKDYGIDKAEFGVLISLFNVTYGLGQIPSGVLGDLVGQRYFLGLGIIAWSLLIACVGLARNFPALAGLQLMLGAAQAGTYPNLSKVTHTWFGQPSRTIVQGWVGAFFGRSGGAMSSLVMATLLIGICGLSWAQALAVMGLAGALFGAAFLLLFRDSPESDRRVNQAERDLIRAGASPSGGAPRVLPWRRVIRSRSMFWFVVQQFTSAGADTVYQAFMGLYFMQAKGFEVAQAGILASLPLWGGAVGGMAGGFCNDWLIRITGSRRWSRTSVGLVGKLMACLLMFLAISRQSGVGAAVALLAVKFFSDWSQPTVWGTCTDLGGRYSATVLGVVNTAGTLGGVACPAAFGLILHYNTTSQLVGGQMTSVTDYNPMFLTVAALYATSALCWLAIDCTRSLERDVPTAGSAATAR